MMQLGKNRLYIANKIEQYDGIPFQKVKIIDFDTKKVTFTTEWPVRELNATINDFLERFREWV